ncbi:hypothetical protein DSM106972_007670 [Dulcicalothrix desertica PCC 7102]|uniref:Uncharacterized protein n=1 Tax=Dulcicalothrix desertica PCC 7102 TaxID=232991 RepID=A0A3S1AWA1_9CYAN|nr:hypothetical protein [Dulcicalothrix desertica]RUT10272.1 hypothetical protein DSM106972_007670 [Dulcicalothrix desertica PCC 7102]TWH40753.1 alpha-L-fucosidase [Dulcicalothrix desertica PCC 7102]
MSEKIDNWFNTAFNPNPTGELTITVPESVIDSYATVIVINITDD